MLIVSFGITSFQGSTGVKFCDVAGIDEAVEELQEVILLYITDAMSPLKKGQKLRPLAVRQQ